uniref:Reverse transcriptase n=1 Tax=Triatoma infestans TaxID=30076 RepID=A0A170YQE2_TRIIF
MKKTIYGLKQSSRSWYERVDNDLLNLGYYKSKFETRLVIKKQNRKPANYKNFIC